MTQVRAVRATGRGFTLVELMIVVAIIGILAALAIYGVARYMANSKTAEARQALGRLTTDAANAYNRENLSGAVVPVSDSTDISRRLCLSASAPVPANAASISNRKYQSSPADWTSGDKQSGWECLKFSMNSPQYYQYSYTATGSEGSWTAMAQGDLDGNGTLSTFRMMGAVQTVNGQKIATKAPAMLEDDALE